MNSSPGGRSWTRWVEPWYGAYGVVGLMMLGVAPILIPLTVEAGQGRSAATAVGVVVAAFYVGGMLAPLVGSFADRMGLQRTVFLVCFPLMAASIVAFSFVEGTWWWALFALVFGSAGSVAGTVAGLFVVEAHPKAEWDDRISWFRLAYGAGQVVGLIIAAIAATQVRFGWLLTAALLALATLLARVGLPKLSAVPAPHRREQPRGIAQLVAAARSRFGILLATWLLTMFGVQTFFNVVPLVMRDAFDLSATISSILFMVGAGVGTLLYPFCGRLAERHGPGLVLLIGLLMTTVSFGVMTLAIYADLPGKAVVGSVALVVAAIAYAFEVVSATMLITQLTSGSEGSAMGLLNGIIAAGAAIGAIAPAFVAGALGYDALPALATGVLLAAILVGLPLYRRKRSTTAAAQA